ncbi:histidinol phosphate phosphatase H [Fomitiporia mediterranea MF3/22]|uniref:histidinol phosphate phosphatase H n=1 Tax=Fomitiporia mediterranea (strain MF3/22) TaxID=694068 RepID=UPI0004409266|nr:histidinol phosphate phosphatase H [Fomitiporia mediterranea MF3/22]EJD02017.1 histidinol phosphate phosphatase H [Fomitiporia mediterranea MF3/22]
MPFSHHSHSGQFCRHASGTLEEVVLEAIRQKFQIYGLSEHVPRYRLEDRYPEEEEVTLQQLESQFDTFVKEAHRLKDLYSSEITILVGAETEYITPVDLHQLALLLERHRGKIEYLVGSVHHVNEFPIDFDKPTFECALQSFAAKTVPGECTVKELLDRYIDAQYDLFTQFHPEIIGHFDLCRLYYPSLDFRDFPDVLAKIERNISYACDYGALFEFNAAAFRKGWSTAYPGKDIVEKILQKGGRFTLSDDSHGPHTVGQNYNKLYIYLEELGIKELWYLELEGTSKNRRRTRAAKLEGDWCSNQFWKTRGLSS